MDEEKTEKVVVLVDNKEGNQGGGGDMTDELEFEEIDFYSGMRLG